MPLLPSTQPKFWKLPRPAMRTEGGWETRSLPGSGTDQEVSASLCFQTSSVLLLSSLQRPTGGRERTLRFWESRKKIVEVCQTHGMFKSCRPAGSPNLTLQRPFLDLPGPQGRQSNLQAKFHHIYRSGQDVPAQLTGSRASAAPVDPR